MAATLEMMIKAQPLYHINRTRSAAKLGDPLRIDMRARFSKMIE